MYASKLKKSSGSGRKVVVKMFWLFEMIDSCINYNIIKRENGLGRNTYYFTLTLRQVDKYISKGYKVELYREDYCINGYDVSW
jgi:hypothetical protein